MQVKRLKKVTLWRLGSLLTMLFGFTQFQQLTELKPFQLTGLAQGTTYAITYYSQREIIQKPQIDSIFSRLDQSLSIYSPTSLISRFNQSATGVETDMHLRQVVQKSLAIFNETAGVFDITVHPLVNAWGFGTEKVTTLPDSATIKSLLACVGSEKLRLNQNWLRKTVPCTRIDVNGIAQGYSVDVIANYLEKHGIRNYMVEVGGEIRVKGRKYPQNTPMSIGIETPTKNEFESASIQTVIEVNQGAVTTSGNYRKYRQVGPNRISHIINPKTGYTSQNELISVTVMAHDAIIADGYDNALLAMGLSQALAFLKHHQNLDAYFIYQKSNGAITDTATAGFYKFMR
ncbi:FAD:protein FMN transferase [Spirosoma sp.]|uniref:FAD:protein FMN transferase n=1 Tax=Spirosoma sp. TaxID=1899569 RepID=UPI00260FE001|nr:FAD:protein FMN transferase [Spirosoma sp.]MCX6213015.1 FAD:protein FMN transferase [Spirosoma sp.]